MELTPKQSLKRFLKLLRMTDIAYAKILKRWDLSLNTTWVLEYLYDHPRGVEPAVLADSTRLLRQTITVVLNDLEKKKWIVRIPQSVVHRRKLIRLTQEGRAFSRLVLGELEKIELTSFSAMTPAEREKLLELVERFYESIAAIPEQVDAEH